MAVLFTQLGAQKRVHTAHPGTSLVKFSSRMCTMEDFFCRTLRDFSGSCKCHRKMPQSATEKCSRGGTLELSLTI